MPERARAICPTCEKETEFSHTHDTAYGMEETHMAGSERFQCTACGYAVSAPDTERFPSLVFVLDHV